MNDGEQIEHQEASSTTVVVKLSAIDSSDRVVASAYLSTHSYLRPTVEQNDFVLWYLIFSGFLFENRVFRSTEHRFEVDIAL